MTSSPKEQHNPVLWASTGLLGPFTILLSTGCERIRNHLPFVWPRTQVLSKTPRSAESSSYTYVPTTESSITDKLVAGTNSQRILTARFCPEGTFQGRSYVGLLSGTVFRDRTSTL